VIVQAGASEDGRAFAGEFAEAIFSNHLSLDQAQKYYADIKSRAAGFGRNPAHVVVMPGLSPVVGRTEAEAKEKEDHLQSLVHPAVAMSILSTVLQGADLSGYDLDGPVPDIHVDENATHSGVENWMQIARRENLTIRQLAQRVTHGRGKSAVVGSAVQVADHMERWFREGGADGFNIMAPVIPGFLDDFCELVIPILQERGLFRREYEGETLRDNLGLPRPENRYRAAKVA
jgi:alkanesulfonate monooxygenase SsuD/methylene tetrahydromethanopterin reductase-like flavin-dependent oxidoreductase (luciferase family)